MIKLTLNIPTSDPSYLLRSLPRYPLLHARYATYIVLFQVQLGDGGVHLQHVGQSGGPGARDTASRELELHAVSVRLQRLRKVNDLRLHVQSHEWIVTYFGDLGRQLIGT